MPEADVCQGDAMATKNWQMIEDAYFEGIKNGDSSMVRQLLQEHRQKLTKSSRSQLEYRFPSSDMELESYKLLGAYLGPLTGLQYCILLGQEGLARDILDATFDEDLIASSRSDGASLSTASGSHNSLLHLAAFVGAKDIICAVLDRLQGSKCPTHVDAALTNRNIKGFTPLDLIEDPELMAIVEKARIKCRIE